MNTLKNANSFIQKPINALDGPLGHIAEFYFDDQSGNIKYIVVDVVKVFIHKKILIKPELTRINDIDHTLYVEKTSDELKKSPLAHNEKPIIEQRKAHQHEHYDWEIYMGSEVLPSNPKHETYFLIEPKNPDGSFFDPHLRTTRVVNGYTAQFNDGLGGKLLDFIIDTSVWNIHCFMISTQGGEKVCLPWALLKMISFEENKIYFNTIQSGINDYAYLQMQSQEHHNEERHQVNQRQVH